MFNKLKASVTEMTSAVGEQSVGMIRSTAEEFNAVRPLFARVGYHVTKVQLEIGLTPKIAFQLSHVADVDDEEFDALLAEHKGNKVLTATVSALRQASQIQEKIRFQGLHFADVEVELGIPPAVKITFLEEKEDGPGSLLSAAVNAVTEAVAPAAPPPRPAPRPPVEQDEESTRQRRDDIEALIQAGRAVRFSCIGCSKSLVVRVRDSGREGACRHCGAPQIIPYPETGNRKAPV